MAEEQKSGDKYWIFATRTVGFILGYLPFIPNTLWYLGMSDEKTQIDTSDGLFIIFGFLTVWGSANFGRWANGLGAGLVNRFKK